MVGKISTPSIVKSPLSFHNKADLANTKWSLFNGNIIENLKWFSFPYTSRGESVPQLSVLVWPGASSSPFLPQLFVGALLLK